MTKVLFVCLGNICRSPMAEAILQHYAAEFDLDILCDSAGTSSNHLGERLDKRALQKLEEYGIKAPHRACKFSVADFNNFDYIFAMDKQNLADILKMWDNSGSAQIMLMRAHDPKPENQEVPDPWYGDMNDFELVYQMLDRTILNFLNAKLFISNNR